jgi:hypothetical protein
MPKPSKFSYAKKAPFRDAFFLIIICEGKTENLNTSDFLTAYHQE